MVHVCVCLSHSRTQIKRLKHDEIETTLGNKNDSKRTRKDAHKRKEALEKRREINVERSDHRPTNEHEHAQTKMH